MSKTNGETPSTSVITGIVTMSYPHVATPQDETNDDGKPTGKKKYSGAFIFDPGADLTKERNAIAAAAEAAYPNGAGIEMLRTGALKQPIRTDAEAKNYPVGSVFLNARSERKPQVVFNYPDPATGKPMLVPEDRIADVLYPGVKVRVSLRAFAYNKKGNKGVSFALGNIQVIADGTRIDGRKAAVDEFTADLTAAPAELPF